MEHRQSLKRQEKSQIVAQTWMEALKKSARRKSIPAATGFGTGTTIPMLPDRNPPNKTSQFLGECPTTSNESGKRILKRILVSVQVFPRHLIPGGKEKIFPFGSGPSESPAFFLLYLNSTTRKGPSSFVVPSSTKPRGQTPLKPDVKSSHLNKKRTLDETDSKMSPRSGKEVKHVTSNSLVVRK